MPKTVSTDPHKEETGAALGHHAVFGVHQLPVGLVANSLEGLQNPEELHTELQDTGDLLHDREAGLVPHDEGQ